MDLNAPADPLPEPGKTWSRGGAAAIHHTPLNSSSFTPIPPPHADFARRVYAWISRIPQGRVATYGQIAGLAGFPRRARHVGHALAHPPPGVDVPWYRVINAQGRISPRQPGHDRGLLDGTPVERRQERLLKAEGVAFKQGRVDLKRFRWQPELEGWHPGGVVTEE